MKTDDAWKQKLREVLDAHDDAIRALDASQRHTRRALRALNDGIEAAQGEQDNAIRAALAANKAAIDLIELAGE